MVDGLMFRGELKPFQKQAFDKMIDRQKVLVGYEMGLGKTVISIAVVEHLLDAGKIGTVLVIVLSSLKYQWKREIDKFTGGDAIVMVVDGPPTKRRRQYEEVKGGGIEYVILNYEQVVNDWQYVRFLPRDCIVLDEATFIKNFAAKRTKRVKKLTAPYRFALTGQPVENRPEEAFSIMQWVDPDVLGPFEVFDPTFIVRDSWGSVQRYRNLKVLHEKISEAMVRKTRSDPDVAPFMPKVGEEALLVSFDPKGAALYRHIADDLLDELSAVVGQGGGFDLFAHYNGGSSEENAARGRIMSRLTCLRMLCDHPDLLRISAERYKGVSVVDGEFVEGVQGGSAYAMELLDAGLLDVPMKSPKLTATVELIKEILSGNPKAKIVLFAFFKDALRFIQRETAKVTDSVLFTGDLNPKEKDAAKQRFQTTDSVRLFLSSDAGGYGVDLPNANYLISYDLPWSAGKLDQRNARIIRLSSEFEAVTLLYMLMDGSIEERMLAMLDQKKAIGAAVVDGKGIDLKGGLNLNLKGLAQFLRESQV